MDGKSLESGKLYVGGREREKTLLPKWGQWEDGEEENIMTSKHGQDQNDGGKTGGSPQGQFFACTRRH